MYKVLKRTCFPFVLQMKYFVLRRSRCRRGYLKVPIIIITVTVDNPSSSLTASSLLLTLL